MKDLRILWTVGNWKRTGPVEPSLDLAHAVRTEEPGVRLLVGRAPRGVHLADTAAGAAAARDLPLQDSSARLHKHRAPLRHALDRWRLRRTLAALQPEVIVTTLLGDHRLLRRVTEGRIPIVRLAFHGPDRSIHGEEFDLLRTAAGVVVFDEASAERLLRGGVDPQRLRHFHPPMGLPALRARAANPEATRAGMGINGKVPLLGIVARMQRHRRFELLWPALARVRDRGVPFHFAVIGRGTHAAEIVREPIQALGLQDQVHTLGYLRGEAYASALAALDAQVFLVPGSDPTCRALREGMALGVPSLAFRRGLLPTYVEHGVTGLLVNEEPDALAEGVATLAADPALRARMGAAARARADARFDASQVAEGVVALLRRVVV